MGENDRFVICIRHTTHAQDEVRKEAQRKRVGETQP